MNIPDAALNAMLDDLELTAMLDKMEAKRLFRGGSMPFAGTSEIPSPDSVLSHCYGALLPMFDTKEATKLRRLCREFKKTVADFPWEDEDTLIHGSVEAWRACFPRARWANLTLADAGLALQDNWEENLTGITVLSLRGATNVTDDLLASLSQLGPLRRLDLRLCTNLTAEGILSLNMAADLLVNLRGTGLWGPDFGFGEWEVDEDEEGVQAGELVEGVGEIETLAVRDTPGFMLTESNFEFGDAEICVRCNSERSCLHGFKECFRSKNGARLNEFHCFSNDDREVDFDLGGGDGAIICCSACAAVHGCECCGEVECSRCEEEDTSIEDGDGYVQVGLQLRRCTLCKRKRICYQCRNQCTHCSKCYCVECDRGESLVCDTCCDYLSGQDEFELNTHVCTNCMAKGKECYNHNEKEGCSNYRCSTKK